MIAFGTHHAENIEEALRRRLGAENDRGLDPFFAMEREERFFVKNIERVQGDERDVIILSVGYHKAANGTLPYRFGPLNQEGGERRLNVAITRARSRIHLVAGFSHHDMDPGRSSAEGVELLRQYLEFAASGGTEMGGSLSDEPLNAFELNIMRQLERRGMPVTPRTGWRATGWTSPALIRSSPVGWSWPWRPTGPVIIQRPRRGTGTGCVSRCWRARAGGFTGSGPPSGFGTLRDRLTWCWRRGARRWQRPRRPTAELRWPVLTFRLSLWSCDSCGAVSGCQACCAGRIAHYGILGAGVGGPGQVAELGHPASY